MPDPTTDQATEPAESGASVDFGTQFLASVRADAATESSADPKPATPAPAPESTGKPPETAAEGEPAPEEQGAPEPSADDKTPEGVSRRGAWKQAQELKAEVEGLKATVAELQSKQLAPLPPDETEAAILKFLGRDVDEHGKTAIERAEEGMRRGDWQANDEYLRLVDNNRLYAPLVAKATQQAADNVKANWAASFMDTSHIPGVDRDALLKTKTPAEAHALIYEAGRAARDAEVTKLKEELAIANSDHASKEAHLISRSLAPMSGGLPASGLPSDASTDDKLRAGIQQREAARNGRH